MRQKTAPETTTTTNSRTVCVLLRAKEELNVPPEEEWRRLFQHVALDYQRSRNDGGVDADPCSTDGSRLH